MRNRTARLAAIACAVLTAAACGSSTAPSTTTTTTVTGAVTESYFSSVVPGGTTTHAFSANAGTIVVTLQSSGPPDSVAISFGIGIPSLGGGACSLATTLTATPGASLSAAVDAGSYCVEVWDPGRLTKQTSFVLVIARP